jgi:hypothetical protein
LAAHLATPGQPPPQLSGRAVISAQLQAPFPAANAHAYEGLVGQGKFQITGGDFGRVPVLELVTDHMHLRDAATVGDAEGEFHVASNKIHFDRALMTSPAAGIDGVGDVGFDSTLNLQFVAKFLGKWGDRVGDVGDGGGVAKLLNGVQKGIDLASRKAAYTINVRGTIDKPLVSGTPVPFLSRQIQRVAGDNVDPPPAGATTQESP